MCEVRAGSRNVQVWSGRWEVRLGEAEQYWLWCPITTRFHHGNGRYDSPTRRVDLTGNSPKLEEWLFHTEMVGCGVWNEDRLSPTLQVTDRVNCWPPTGVFKPDSISQFSVLNLPEAFIRFENLQYTRTRFIFIHILLVIFIACCLQLCFIMGLKDAYYMTCYYCTDYNHPLASRELVPISSSDMKIPKCSGPC